MAQIALGWLGWSEEQALAADVNAIIAGYEGKGDMLRAIFGGRSESASGSATPVSSRPMSKDLFDAIFG